MDFRRTFAILLAISATLLPVGARAQSGIIQPLPASGFGSTVLPEWKTLLRFDYTGGSGVGFRDDFASLGLFQPFADTGSSLWYVDARGALFTNRDIPDNGTSVEANIGLGFRRPSFTGPGLIGMSAWYDVSNLNRNTYQQVAIGLEYFGPDFDISANAYLPVGPRDHLVSDTGLLAPIFVGNNAVFPRTRIEEQGLGGFDTEIGTCLLGSYDRRHLRGYVGGYYYEGNDIDGSGGISVRLVAHISSALAVHAQVTQDEIFDTNVAFGLTWLFPGGGCRSCRGHGCSECGEGPPIHYSAVNGQSPDQLEYDLYRPVRRNPHIAVRDAVLSLPETATDPNTGLPFNFLHVSSNAAPGGDGSVEMPFMTLAETQAAAMAGDILFAHADSVFAAESITLPQDVRFLGEGLPHMFTTAQLGVQLIPRATTGTVLPTIENAPGNAITVMDGDEVAGFIVTDPALAGIFADSVAGMVNVHDNMFMGGTNGANIVNSTGTFTFTDNTITNPTGTAFNIDGGSPTVTQAGAITNNAGRVIAVANTTGGTATFNGPLTDDGGEGILVQNAASDVVVNNATLANNAGNAIDVVNSTGDSTFNGMVITNPTGVALNVDGGAPTVNYSGTIANMSDRSVRVANTTGGTVTTTGSITDDGGEGLLVDSNAGDVVVNNATLNNSAANAIDVLNSTGTSTFNGAVVTNPTGVGLNVDGGAPTVNHTGAITNTSDRSVRVANTTGGTVTTSGPITDNGGDGILVQDAAGDVAISNATLNNSTGNAVDIQGSSGDVNLSGIAINTPTADGVDVEDSNANLSGLTINSAGGHGIEVTNAANDREVAITGSTINGATNEGIELNVDGTGNLKATLGGNSITSTGNAFDAATSAAGGSLELVLNNNTLSSANGAGARVDGSAGGLLTVTSLAGNTVTNGMTGGMLFETVSFDGSTTVAGIQNVDGGNTTIGSLGNRVTGDGLRLNQVLGSLAFDDLNIFNDMGTGLFIRDAGGKGGTFLFSSTGGVINTTNGPAMDIDPVELNMTLTNVTSTDSPTQGIILDTVTGMLTIGTTTVTNSTNSGLVVRNSGGFMANFGATTIMGTGVTGGAVGHGIELMANPNALFTFGTLNVMTDNGTGLLANNSGTINMLTPGTIKSIGGPVVDLTTTSGQSNGAAGWTFASLMSTDSITQGLHLDGLSDSFAVTGTTTIDNPTGIGIEIDGGTAGISFNSVAINSRNNIGIDIDGGNQNVTFGATTIDNPNNSPTTALNIANTLGGNVTFSQVAIDNNDTPADGVALTNNAAAINIQGGSISGAGGNAVSPGAAVRIDGGTADITIGANITNEAGRAVDVVNRTRNTTRFTGTINDSGAGTGINIQNIAGSTAKNEVRFDGTVNLGTTSNRLTGGQALTVNNGGEPAGNAVVTFANLNVATDAQPGIVATNGGTLNITNGTIDTVGTGATGLRLNGLETDIRLSRITINNTGTAVPAVDIDNITGRFQVTGTTAIGGTGLVGTGVDIRGGTADITFNVLNVTNNSGTSLFVDGMNGLLTISSGTIANGAGAAVNIEDTGMNVFLNSVSSSGAVDGLRLSGTTGMFTASGGVIQNTSDYGVELVNADGVRLTGLMISNTGNDGVTIQGGSRNVTLTSLNISSTTGDGIEVFSGSNLVFNNNIIESTSLSGIQLLGPGIDSVSISGGRITNPGARGIEILSATNVTVSNVTLNGPGGALISPVAPEAVNGANGNGIEIRRSVDVVLNGNAINGFNNAGIHILATSGELVRATIENNFITNIGQNFNPAAGTPAWDGISLNVSDASSRIFLFGNVNNSVINARDKTFSREETGTADVDNTIFGQIRVNNVLVP